jgi:hypothetical protein
MRNVFRLLALVVVMMAVNTAFAHHSFGATYDTSKQLKIEGKLVQFVYRRREARFAQDRRHGRDRRPSVASAGGIPDADGQPDAPVGWLHVGPQRDRSRRLRIPLDHVQRPNP